MTLDQATRLIADAQDLGVSVINFVGGEPLMRRDLPKIVAAVDKDRSTTLLFTNGWALEERAKELRQAGLALLLVLVVILEIIVVNLGIRSYAPEVLQATCGITILGAPLEILFYVPVFSALVITFYKYWSFFIDDASLIPVNKRKWLRAIVIAFVGVFLFELMVEPMFKIGIYPSGLTFTMTLASFSPDCGFLLSLWEQS